MNSTESNATAARLRSLPKPALVASLVAPLAVVCLLLTSGTEVSAQASMPVFGEGVHDFATAIIHSSEETDTGMIQRSTDIVTLSGDLQGHLLYHPTSVFDFGNETLVNTGSQIFSGTVLGSAPVILHDDEFRFDVDLASGETRGTVHLGRSKDSPQQAYWYTCDLHVTGTGLTDTGNATFTYSGHCTRMGQP